MKLLMRSKKWSVPSLLFGFCLLIIAIIIIKPFLHKPILKKYDLNNIESFTVYDIDLMRNQTIVSLDNIIHKELDPNQVKILFSNLEYNRHFTFLDKPMWKGGSLGVIEFSDRSQLQIALSYLGYLQFVDESGIYTFKDQQSDLE